jgi:hypothetical protein
MEFFCFLQRSRYSDWLLAGQTRGQGSSSDKVKFAFLHSVQTGSGSFSALGARNLVNALLNLDILGGGGDL